MRTYKMCDKHLGEFNEYFLHNGGSMTSTPRALVLRAPGINCDRETAHACRLVGFETQLVHINSLLKAPDTLLDYDFLVIPGGFSYGDDLGAGTLLAKNLTIHLGTQLQQFMSLMYHTPLLHTPHHHTPQRS